MNVCEPFTNLFELSKTETAPVKTASIIQYALASLVSCKNISSSLFKYWLAKENLDDNFQIDAHQDYLKSYINYCVNCLKEYFRAIRHVFPTAWTPESKLLKVISLNAFIIAFRDTLDELGGPKGFNFYADALLGLDIDFLNTNKDFPYAGAQYSKFANDLIIPLYLEQNDKK